MSIRFNKKIIFTNRIQRKAYKVTWVKQKKKLKHLKGLIYFSDGDGIFPNQEPDYETAFVFLGEPKENVKIPKWVLSLSLSRTK